MRQVAGDGHRPLSHEGPPRHCEHDAIGGQRQHALGDLAVDGFELVGRLVEIVARHHLPHACQLGSGRMMQGAHHHWGLAQEQLAVGRRDLGPAPRTQPDHRDAHHQPPDGGVMPEAVAFQLPISEAIEMSAALTSLLNQSTHRDPATSLGR